MFDIRISKTNTTVGGHSKKVFKWNHPPANTNPSLNGGFFTFEAFFVTFTGQNITIMFKLIQTNAGFHFNLIAANNKVIGTSEVYEGREGAENGIESVRKNGIDRNNFKNHKNALGDPYFTVHAQNGEVILTSQMYDSKRGMVNGKASVVAHAASTKVVFIDKRKNP